MLAAGKFCVGKPAPESRRPRRRSVAASTICSRKKRLIWRRFRDHLCTPPMFGTAIFRKAQFSHVIHAATEASAKLNSEAPLVMFDTDRRRHAAGTAVLPHAAPSQDFSLVSSGAVYGNQPPQVTHVNESFTGGPDPLDRASAYAEGKRARGIVLRGDCFATASKSRSRAASPSSAPTCNWTRISPSATLLRMRCVAARSTSRETVLHFVRISTRPISPSGSGPFFSKDNPAAPTTWARKTP